MNENKKEIVNQIDKINSALSIINSICEKSASEDFIFDISVNYPFSVCLEELNAMFNYWKWDIKETMEE